MQAYVDDPVLVVRGSRGFRRVQIAILLLAWRVLGVSLAIKKGQLGRLVDWVGITVSVHQGGVVATVQEARMQDIAQMADTIAQSNVVSLRDLRSFTGKCQSVASLLYVWRPFVHIST